MWLLFSLFRDCLKCNMYSHSDLRMQICNYWDDYSFTGNILNLTLIEDWYNIQCFKISDLPRRTLLKYLNFIRRQPRACGKIRTIFLLRKWTLIAVTMRSSESLILSSFKGYNTGTLKTDAAMIQSIMNYKDDSFFWMKTVKPRLGCVSNLTLKLLT